MSFGVTAAAVGSIGGALISSKGAGKAAQAGQDAAAQQQAMQWGLYQQQRQDQYPYRYAGTNALNALAMRLGIGSYNPNSLATANLIDLSSGVPQANQDLYNTNPAYRAAWDKLATQHYQQYGRAYDQSSSVSMINEALRGALAPEIASEQSAQAQQNADNASNPLYGSLLRNFTADDFKTDPGYDFRIQQGQKQIEGSAAARGGLLSGAAAKALTKYNQDFASNEYSNAYNRFNNDQNTIFNRLAGIANVGQTATNAVQSAGNNYGSGASQAIQYGGAARASGYANQANALAGGLGSLTGYGVNALSGAGGGGGYGYTGSGSLFGGSTPTYGMGTNYGFGAMYG